MFNFSRINWINLITTWAKNEWICPHCSSKKVGQFHALSVLIDKEGKRHNEFEVYIDVIHKFCMACETEVYDFQYDKLFKKCKICHYFNPDKRGNLCGLLKQHINENDYCILYEGKYE